MKLCALVFFCLLVPSATVTDSCLHKTVVVMVLNGSGLSGDGFDDPEPYVVVKIGNETRETDIDFGAKPAWLENFKFDSVSTDVMQLEVWEKDWGFRGDDDFLGACTEPLSQHNSSKIIECAVEEGGSINFSYKCQ